MPLTIETFLPIYFRTKSPAHQLLIWTNPGKRSYWFSDAQAAQAFALKCTEKNVYFGLGLTSQAYAPHQRTSHDRVTAIASVWIDIDIAGPGHKSDANVLSSRDDALTLLSKLPLAPTATIFSGGGLHAHWLLESLYACEDATARTAAVGLVQGWQEFVRRTSLELFGASIDATHDLARVLRIPGTFNLKGDPIPVELLDANDTYYAPQDFEEYLALDGAKPNSLFVPSDYTPSAGTLFNPDAQVNHDLWEALAQIEPKFADSWKRKRKDLNDQSASGYDLSMANYAVQAGWTDQEIVDLLIANHRTHGEAMKRQSYYLRTITTARQSVERLRAQEAIEDYVVFDEPKAAAKKQASPAVAQEGTQNDAPDPSSDDAIDDVDERETKEKMLRDISTMLNIRVMRIIKFTSDPPTYRLETDRGAIMLPNVEYLISQQKLRTAVAAATGRLIESYKPNQWQTLAQALLSVCETQEVGQETTDRGAVRDWLHAYLRKRRPLDDPQEGKEARLPYRQDGRVHLFMADFVAWLFLEYNERHSAKELGPKFTVAGAQVKHIYVKGESGKPTTTTVWQLPDDL